MKKLFLLGLLGLQQVTFIFTISYDFTCPPRSQWKKRALQKCHPKVYHCLFDVNSGTFREVCQGSSFPLEKGVKVVLSKNLDTEKCPENLYMPYIIKSDESHDCVFSKSSCNEEGQITCRVRSGEKDVVCACNFFDGYAFIQTPKHISYCVPSEEDCSCYRKSETLTQDYPRIPQDETCDLQQFSSMVISFEREKHKDSFTEANMISLQKPEALESKVPCLDRNKDKHKDGILVLVFVLVVIILGNIFITSTTLYKETKETAFETTYEPKPDMKNISTALERFSFHCKVTNEPKILEGKHLKEKLENEPRILDMCFMKSRDKLFLVWIDADNKTIVKYSILPERESGKHKYFTLKDDTLIPNRLSKINETLVAVIYKKKFEILILNVIQMKEVMTCTIKEDVTQLLESGIQGFVALNETEFIVSDKTKLYKCNLKNDNNILIPEKFGNMTFDTARRLTRVPRNKNNSKDTNSGEMIIIADENDKQMTILRGYDGSVINQQSKHNRGLQNVRAIVSTAERVFAATSAGVSVYHHSDGNFQKFDDGKDYMMLLEYKQHVEHTRSLCLGEINDNFYLALSGVNKQKDFILIATFKKDSYFFL